MEKGVFSPLTSFKISLYLWFSAIWWWCDFFFFFVFFPYGIHWTSYIYGLVFFTEFGNVLCGGVGEVGGHYSFKYFFCTVLSPLPFWNSTYTFELFHRSLKPHLFYLFQKKYLCFSLDHFYYLASSLLIHYSIVFNLLLMLSKLCFPSGAVFFWS